MSDIRLELLESILPDVLVEFFDVVGFDKSETQHDIWMENNFLKKKMLATQTLLPKVSQNTESSRTIPKEERLHIYIYVKVNG